MGGHSERETKKSKCKNSILIGRRGKKILRVGQHLHWSLHPGQRSGGSRLGGMGGVAPSSHGRMETCPGYSLMYHFGKPGTKNAIKGGLRMRNGVGTSIVTNIS